MITSSLTGCIRDDFNGQSCFQQDGKTQLVLSIGNLADIQTYSEGSTNECYINDNLSDGDHYYDLYILVFGSDGKYKSGEAIEKTNVNGTNGNKQRTAAVPQLTIGDKFVILINTGISKASETQGLKALTVGTSTATDINAAFPSDAWNINQTTTGNSGKGMPMSSALTTYSTSASTPTINIYRSVAKIQLSVNVNSAELPSDITNFTDNTVTWAMANEVTKGAVYSGTPTGVTVIPTLTSSDFHTLAESDFTRYGVSYTGDLDKKTYYLPEYTSSTLAKGTTVGISAFAADRACMVIKHNDKYYRIDLAQKQTEFKYNYLDIKRNCHYTVNITKVKSVGYETFGEAIANPPSNLEYEIIVEGDNDNVIVSNGQYAMSLECDKIIAYVDDATEMAIKVKAILGSGSSLLPATDTITASTGITMTGITKLTTIDQDIKFTMSGTSGTITVKLGNLSRTINITRNDPLDAHYNNKTITGDFSTVKWIKTDENISITVNGTSSIKIHTDENITSLNSSALTDPTVEPAFEGKYAEGFVVGRVNRTKILIVQIAPSYIGWSGGDPNGSTTYYSKRLVTESVEEGYWSSGWTGTLSMYWYPSKASTGGPQDVERGKNNTYTIASRSAATSYRAAYACWMKNDKNGDGSVSTAEWNDAGWYLPAYKQLVNIWLSLANLNSKLSNKWYWSSTECSEVTTGANYISFTNGSSDYYSKNTTCNTRCVREINTTTTTSTTQQVRTEGNYVVIDCTTYPKNARRESVYSPSQLTPHNEKSALNSLPYNKLAVSKVDNSSGASWSNASTVCNDYTGPAGGEAGMWRLPTQREVYLIWTVKSKLQAQSGFSALSSSTCWCATYYSGSTTESFYIDWTYGYSPTAGKYRTFTVRCVREF